MIVQLEGDIRTRLTGDTTLTALLGATSSVFNQYVPPDTAFPYVWYVIENSENVETFRTASIEVSFSVHWAVEERANAYDPIARARAIELRLFGDWYAQSAGTAPTYGLNRWQPTLSGSGWSADIVSWQGTRPNHAEGVMAWYQEYTVRLSKAGA